jgi:hypothetical protein
MIIRSEDASFIFDCIANGDSCSIVGVSNIGKSHLLRSVCRPEIIRSYLGALADRCVFVYIDFNLMVDMSEQGFYELILRAILAELTRLEEGERLATELNRAYEKTVNPANPFQIPLSFNEGIISLCESWEHRLILLFDEFDEVFRGIDDRAYLNLRALRDRYRERLCYVVVTEYLLRETRRSPQAAEFCELFDHNIHHLAVLGQPDIIRVIETFDAEERAHFLPEDIQFVGEQAGGHPGLLLDVCHLLAQALQEDGTEQARRQNYRAVRARLDDDLNTRIECAKIWNALAPEEQEALIKFVAARNLAPDFKRRLQRRGVLIERDGREDVFGQIFAGFVHRQGLVKGQSQQGVRIDVESGVAWVDGEAVPTLTDLEYRLLLLFYGRLNKIVSKYEIVETVWGQDYIESVDDARIEKLVSRLRTKLESPAGSHSYLQTVRGRGYRLVSPELLAVSQADGSPGWSPEPLSASGQ